MAIEITHVRFGSTSRTEDQFVRYKWKNVSDGNTGDSDKPTLVDWIDNKNGTAYVGSGPSRVNVGAVRPQSGQPHLRTYADGKWTNNLLNLPIF
ncbi:DUF3892 domain-containing protein [Leucobacter triazinivorans]|uniref:DUF3892 domain-containing protein n=1 Tax=Leucobacter triazinivorans TaxID=1784719 RepID=A0A4P6KDT1_9MICO|nr:DUF3892 domain-containing protein [Leucobacter triazinivorans]QBE48240.1 DUF3892 domain-containing protein [Leucobacter triazinivorans]